MATRVSFGVLAKLLSDVKAMAHVALQLCHIFLNLCLGHSLNAIVECLVTQIGVFSESTLQEIGILWLRSCFQFL